MERLDIPSKAIEMAIYNAEHVPSASFNQPAYDDVLMKTARANLQQHPSVSIVVACMAAEVLTEQVLSRAFKKRGIEDLEAAVTAFMTGNSLGSERNRKLYIALTGDAIQDQPFWADYKRATEWRNQAVHAGRQLSMQEAETACTTIDAVLAHLRSTMEHL